MTDERPRYAHWFRCSCCGGRFSVVRLTADPAKVKTPKCPRKRCTGKVRQSHMPDVGMDVAAGKAPGLVGSAWARGYDMALDAAAHNAGLTNVIDNPRYGESSAPKLPPKQQALADSFWGKPAAPAKTITKRVDLQGIFGQRAVDAQKSSPIPGMTHGTAFSAPIASQIVNKPGAGPPIATVAQWPPAPSS